MVRRSGLRMWLMAIGGIPLMVIALDVLTARRITDWLRGLVFRPEDTQIFEPRDTIYAWAMLLFAAFLVLWGLKELFLPTAVIECKIDGLALKLGGPTRQAAVIPWASVVDVSGASLEDEGDLVPVLLIDLKTRDGLPDDPWGARWVGDGRLAVLAQDWSQSPGDVAAQIENCASEAVPTETRSDDHESREEE